MSGQPKIGHFRRKEVTLLVVVCTHVNIIIYMYMYVDFDRACFFVYY